MVSLAMARLEVPVVGNAVPMVAFVMVGERLVKEEADG